MSEIITEIILYLISSGLLVMAGRWIAKKVGWNLGRDEFFVAVEAMGDRVVDKYRSQKQLEITAAKAADSDGGVKVTAAEIEQAESRARQAAYDEMLASLKGEGLEYAKAMGPVIVKGLIGKFAAKRDAKDAAK